MVITPDLLQQVSLYAVSVIGVVEAIKRIIKLKGAAAFILSLLVSLGACIPVLAGGAAQYFLVSALVCAAANGLFKAFHK